MRPLSLCRNVLTFYTLILEASTSLPVSDTFKDILVIHDQAHTLAYWLALFSNIYLMTAVFVWSVYLGTKAVFKAMTWFSPALRRHVEARRRLGCRRTSAAKGVLHPQEGQTQTQNDETEKKEKESKWSCWNWRKLIIDLTVWVCLLANDALFNRVIGLGEGGSSLDEAIERFRKTFDESRYLFKFEVLVLGVGFAVVVGYEIVREAWRGG